MRASSAAMPFPCGRPLPMMSSRPTRRRSRRAPQRRSRLKVKTLAGCIMIDRESRDACAQLLRALAARELSGDEFETAMGDLSSEDPAIRAMFTQGWSLYTEGCHVDRQTARAVRPDLARSVLFLHGDAEYRWPPYPSGDFPIYNWLFNILTLGWWEHRKALRLRAWEQHGDVSVWPFHSRAEFEVACSSPRFLVGSS